MMDYRNVLDVDIQRMINLMQLKAIPTAILTGSGEPTLEKPTLLRVAQQLATHIPFVELHTNGLLLMQDSDYIKAIANSGVKTVALSIYSLQNSDNLRLFNFGNPEGYNLPELVNKLKEHNLKVRLNVAGAKGYVDSWSELKAIIEWAKYMGIHQVTYRPVKEFDGITNEGRRYVLYAHDFDRGRMHYEDGIKWLRRTEYGGEFLDYKGVSLFISECNTVNHGNDWCRQLIYFVNEDRLAYDWKNTGSTLV